MLRFWPALLMALLFTPMCVPKLMLGVAGSFTPGLEDDMLSNVKQCKIARRALGKDIHFQWGLGCGGFESDGPNQSGNGQFIIPIGGSKSSGRYWYHTTKHGAVTTVHYSKIVMDDDREIDLIDCVYGAPARKAAKKAKRQAKKTKRQAKKAQRKAKASSWKATKAGKRGKRGKRR
jgi:hypothetical protein